MSKMYDRVCKKKTAAITMPKNNNPHAPKLFADKGKKGGHCNVTACQAPEAYYYNKSTQKYYCAYCAEQINWIGGRKDTMELFGVPLLCELDPEDNNEH